MASATILISFRFLHARSHSLLTIHRHHHRHPSPSLLTFHQLPEHSNASSCCQSYPASIVPPTLSLSLRLSIPHSPLSHPDTPGLLCFSSGQIYFSIDIAFFSHLPFPAKAKHRTPKILPFIPHLLALTLFLRLRRETRNSSVIYIRSSLAPYSPHVSRQFIFTSQRSSSTFVVRCEMLSAKSNAHRSASNVESRPCSIL